MTCIMCGGELREIGTLGNLIWYSCRDCGLHQSETVDIDDDRYTKCEHWEESDG